MRMIASFIIHYVVWQAARVFGAPFLTEHSGIQDLPTSHNAVSGQSKDRGAPAQPNIDSPNSGSNTKKDLTENKPRFARMPLSGERAEGLNLRDRGKSGRSGP